jgi:hypothetical protein
MLSRIFPKEIDNTYRGRWLAVWIFVPVVLLKATQGVNSIIMTRQVMTTADGIPLDAYGAAGAEAAIAMFALLGLYLLILPIQSLIVLIRYRAMIPFMYLLLLLVQVSSRLLLMVHPIVRSSEPPMGFAGHPTGFYINLGILALTLIGFVLSLSTAETKCAGRRRESVPVGLREKGFEALVCWCVAARFETREP